ncbi:MAG: beta-carotene 15,15-monooxygenase [Mucilaginibacter sp.]|nr:beta-carotene 15,15-monooxygenase [Mucilaginibacter sp.]
MINLFRNYNPLNILWLAILLFVLRIGYMAQIPEKVEFIFVEPFARLLVPVKYEYAFSPLLNVILAGGLVFVQALLLNSLINHHNLLGKPTFLPALMYITLSGLFTPFLTLSAPLICNFLLIWMLFKLFNLYKGDDVKSTTYDLGMIVAAGSLVYFPFIYLFLAIWIALIIYRPFNWREWVISILGYATVFFFLGVIYFMNDMLPRFSHIWLPLGKKFPDHISINFYNYLLLGPVIVILVLCFFKLQQNFFKSYVQIRKTFQLLFFIFLITALSFYINSEFRLSHFLLCAVPATVFFAYYFLYATKRWFYEILYLVLFISIIYFQFNKF